MTRILAALLLGLAAPPLAAQGVPAASPPEPLAIGETFTIESRVLGETRRINVYTPPLYGDTAAPLPVLYMPDGGIGEDFLHVAGLVQISSLNGTMRPFRLVGIENTERRRDLTGPTDDPEDRAIAPRVGGSAAFRRFLGTELMPAVRARYRTTGETAIVGESLAGLFIVETFLLEPDLFDTYLAFDPSLWWDRGRLAREAPALLRRRAGHPGTLYLASSSQEGIVEPTRRLAEALEAGADPALRWHYEDMPEETHATIYHPAALRAFRRVFGPEACPARPFAAFLDLFAEDPALQLQWTRLPLERVSREPGMDEPVVVVDSLTREQITEPLFPSAALRAAEGRTTSVAEAPGGVVRVDVVKPRTDWMVRYVFAAGDGCWRLVRIEEG